MKIISATLATIGALSAASATAQSLPDNMYIDGNIELTYMSSAGLDETFSTGSIDFGLTPRRGTGIGIGFSLGIDAIDFDAAGISEIVVYPAATFALGNTGLLSVGVPRSVLDKGYLAKDTMAYASTQETIIQSVGIAPSLVSTLYLYGPNLIGDDLNVYGLRYDGEFGNTKLGASYHRLSASGDHIDAYAIAFQHQFGAVGSLPDTQLFGGIERLSSSGTDVTTYTLGAEAHIDTLRVGLILMKNDGYTDISTTNLYADYNITDNFAVAGSVLHLAAAGFSEDIITIGTEYRFMNGGYVNASYSNKSPIGSDGLYEVSLGWRF